MKEVALPLHVHLPPPGKAHEITVRWAQMAQRVMTSLPQNTGVGLWLCILHTRQEECDPNNHPIGFPSTTHICKSEFLPKGCRAGQDAFTALESM